MVTYAELETGTYYLVKKEAGDDIMLVKPLMETGTCVLLLSDNGEEEFTFWQEKKTSIHQIIDELTEEEADEYESLFEEEEEEDEF